MTWGPHVRWGDGDPFERVEIAAKALARRVAWEQGNRIGLLVVHAVVGVIAGGQMLLTGGPTQIEALFGPIVARCFLGSLGLFGGLTLFTGLAWRPRSIAGEAVGLAIIGVWDLSMTLGLGWARLHSTSWGFSWPWDREPSATTGYVPAYPVAVYGGMALLICIHLSTLRKFVKYHAPPAPPLSVLKTDDDEERKR